MGSMDIDLGNAPVYGAQITISAGPSTGASPPPQPVPSAPRRKAPVQAPVTTYSYSWQYSPNDSSGSKAVTDSSELTRRVGELEKKTGEMAVAVGRIEERLNHMPTKAGLWAGIAAPLVASVIYLAQQLLTHLAK